MFNKPASAVRESQEARWEFFVWHDVDEVAKVGEVAGATAYTTLTSISKS